MIEDIEKKILAVLKNKKNYKDYIRKKNQIEKRKFLTFLLIINTNLTLSQLSNLTVDNFIKLKEGELITINPDKKDPFNVTNAYLLNQDFSSLFSPDLYNNFIKLKNDDDKLLCSIINKKPISKHNLKKDFNEIVTDILLEKYTKSRLNR
nr:hypothetical protein [Ulva laetevirens]